jgi:hypothetical protein
MDKETRFEIAAAIAPEFIANLPKDGTDEVRVSPAEAPSPQRGAPRGVYAGAPKGPKPSFMRDKPPRRVKK